MRDSKRMGKGRGGLYVDGRKASCTPAGEVNTTTHYFKIRKERGPTGEFGRHPIKAPGKETSFTRVFQKKARHSPAHPPPSTH